MAHPSISTTAFLSPTTFTTSIFSNTLTSRKSSCKSISNASFATCRPRHAYMTATPPAPSEEDQQPESTTPEASTAEEADGQTSASEILKTLREDSAIDMATKPDEDDRSSRSMLGVYRDVDGKSNVWAVEPLEETDTRPQLSKTVIVLVAAAFIIGTLLLLPLLPFTNPDQA